MRSKKTFAMFPVGKKTCLSLTCLALAVMSTIGCSRSNLPTTVPVHGKVTWKGQPLGEGKVCFTPTNVPAGKMSRPAVGDINADGSYQAATFHRGDGLLPGEYRVAVDDRPQRISLDEPLSTPKVHTPEQYRDPSKSGLSFKVPTDARGVLTYDIELK